MSGLEEARVVPSISRWPRFGGQSGVDGVDGRQGGVVASLSQWGWPGGGLRRNGPVRQALEREALQPATHDPPGGARRCVGDAADGGGWPAPVIESRH